MNVPTDISTSYLMSFAVQVGKPMEVTNGSSGRRFIPITGGTVSGRLNGRVCAGGGDWQTIGEDGTIELEARYFVEIEDHGMVEVHATGVRFAEPDVLAALSRGDTVDPGLVYFRSTMRFTSTAPSIAWLNRRLCVSTGRREASQVILDIFELN